ncbi:hypothetical protein EI94DRAFT_1704634 [Lactarius quietus]|nr:hypothetical protein EI94DRAFT_1704634 [Lactarius quietus]
MHASFFKFATILLVASAVAPAVLASPIAADGQVVARDAAAAAPIAARRNSVGYDKSKKGQRSGDVQVAARDAVGYDRKGHRSEDDVAARDAVGYDRKGHRSEDVAARDSAVGYDGDGHRRSEDVAERQLNEAGPNGVDH